MNCKTLIAAFAIMMAAAPTTWAQAQTENTNATTTATAAADDDAKYATTLLKPGTQAPAFSLSTADGKTLSLSELKGRYVVLDFWASWCPDCRRDLPHMVRMQQTYGPRGVQFVGVSFDEKKDYHHIKGLRHQLDTLSLPHRPRRQSGALYRNVGQD